MSSATKSPSAKKSARRQWLWFFGLYGASVFVYGGFELIVHWIIGA